MASVSENVNTGRRNSTRVSRIDLAYRSAGLIYFVYKLFDKFKDNKRVNKALKLIRASTFATILVSCFTVIKNTVLTNSNQLNFKVILLGIILYFCMKKKKLHPLIYMAISGVIGIVFSFNM